MTRRPALGAAGPLSPLPIAGGDLSFLRRLPFPLDDGQVFETLVREAEWSREQVTILGQSRQQARLTAWYGDPATPYSYSGRPMNPLPWTGLLEDLKRAVEACTGAAFNGVLLNLYRDESDRMGFHSDSDCGLGPEPAIASLSYGAARTLVFRHKRADLPPLSLRLGSGSLLLMKGETQENWLHGMDCEPRPCGPRLNLTFRRVCLGTDQSSE